MNTTTVVSFVEFAREAVGGIADKNQADALRQLIDDGKIHMGTRLNDVEAFDSLGIEEMFMQIGDIYDIDIEGCKLSEDVTFGEIYEMVFPSR